jgi:hypothetical protein
MIPERGEGPKEWGLSSFQQVTGSWSAVVDLRYYYSTLDDSFGDKSC